MSGRDGRPFWQAGRLIKDGCYHASATSEVLVVNGHLEHRRLCVRTSQHRRGMPGTSRLLSPVFGTLQMHRPTSEGGVMPLPQIPIWARCRWKAMEVDAASTGSGDFR